jgi:hypothetical protein
LFAFFSDKVEIKQKRPKMFNWGAICLRHLCTSQKSHMESLKQRRSSDHPFITRWPQQLLMSTTAQQGQKNPQWSLLDNNVKMIIDRIWSFILRSVWPFVQMSR